MRPESFIPRQGSGKTTAKSNCCAVSAEALEEPLFLASNGIIDYPEQSAATGIRSM
jgi:hypothetical protein